MIAFLGLGNMGGPMAANLAGAGHPVTGYDPAPEAADAARAAGIALAPTAAAAVSGADTVVTMLPTGAHLRECYAAVLPRVSAGTLLVDCSTVAVEDARAAAAQARAAGAVPVDAPVSGGVAGARDGTLTFMVGGDAAGYGRAAPLLEAMGARAVHCGPSGAGQAAKICNNMILGISMIAVSEAFVLGRALGLTDQALFDVAAASSGQCWALTRYCPVPGPVPDSPANRGYAGGFAAALMLKDLRLARDAAAATGVPAHLGAAAAGRYEAFVAADADGRDFSAIVTAIADRAGRAPEETR
ncbi:3-hydroxyisobutyrate dehydrogenase [Pilimelia terevasa]|uniref:3-hydroxyisobutyrate dehydrogenase n=1 Tax=Pilimelia terevasa TaxID=53372 RepID=A0A8J3BL37_9ACTN|nr:3-hydroxyisobutyrate dehydrogenase [Pilimelia terevasa]GGK28861.1 3-hydroxyisobutyrate dehydrogenase [Pilimelia terevasa]